MFSNILRTTALVNENADPCFEGAIEGTALGGGDSSFRGDVVLLSAMRAVLDKRRGDHRVFLTYINQYCSGSDSNGAIARKVIDNVSFDEPGLLTVMGLGLNNDRCKDDLFQEITARVTENCDGWIEVPAVREYFLKSFPLQCFVNVEKKSALLVAGNLTVTRVHLLALAIPVVLPWYFGEDNKCTEAEKAVLRACTQTSSEPFEAAIEAIAKDYDFKTAKIRRVLSGIETRFVRNKAQSTREEIEQLRSNLEDYYRRISDALREIDDKGFYLIGLESKIAEGVRDEDSEIMQFFLHNDHIDLVSCGDREIRFICTGYLNDFDEDTAEDVIKNRFSVLYRNTRVLNKDDLFRFYKAVFMDRTIKIRTCAAYRVMLQGSVSGMGGYNFPESYNRYFPNPHIQGHSCTGGYGRDATKALEKQDYVTALNICCMSVCNMNFRDGTVMGTLADHLFSDNGWNRKCVELPDGTVVKPEEAVKWLKEQENAKKEEEA